MTLQLGRSYASLLALVRAAMQGAMGEARQHAHRIASIVLGGARDRSRDAYQRPLCDQQRRTESLTSKRPPRKEYLRRGRKDQGDKPAIHPSRPSHRRSKSLVKKPRRARNSSRKKAKGTR